MTAGLVRSCPSARSRSSAQARSRPRRRRATSAGRRDAVDAFRREAAATGGKQQRAAVARALANDPSVILADEPTAALDSHRGRPVMELFSRVAHERGAGVIVVTHDQRALDVFDTIYEMEDGLLKPQEHPHEHPLAY